MKNKTSVNKSNPNFPMTKKNNENKKNLSFTNKNSSFINKQVSNSLNIKNYQENSELDNTYISNLNNATDQGKNNDSNRLSYNHIKNFTEELERIKSVCKELKKSLEENCIMENEKKTFDKMKNEYIKITSDVGIIKEDIKEILLNYGNLNKRLNYLEEENTNLRNHNKNLIKLMQNKNDFNNNLYEQEMSNNCDNNYLETNNVQYKFNKPTKQNQENINNIPIPKFNNLNYGNNFNCNKGNDINFSVPISDLSAFNNVNNTSSNDMNMIINKNLENKSSRRFLIQKETYDQEDYNYSNINNYNNNLNTEPNNYTNRINTINNKKNNFQ